VARELSADLEAVETEKPVDLKDGQTMKDLTFGAWLGKLPKVKPPKKDLSAYDMVVVGAPMWAFGLASPMRAFLCENRGRLPKKAGAFSTSGNPFGGRALRQMEKYSGIKAAAKLHLREKEIKAGGWEKKAKEFADRLR